MDRKHHKNEYHREEFQGLSPGTLRSEEVGQGGENEKGSSEKCFQKECFLCPMQLTYLVKWELKADHWISQDGEHRWPWQEPVLWSAGHEIEESETGSVDSCLQDCYGETDKGNKWRVAGGEDANKEKLFDGRKNDSMLACWSECSSQEEIIDDPGEKEKNVSGPSPTRWQEMDSRAQARTGHPKY